MNKTKYELQVSDDGDIEVRKIPEGTQTNNLVFPNITGLTYEIHGYGTRTPVELEAMKAQLDSAAHYEWITV